MGQNKGGMGKSSAVEENYKKKKKAMGEKTAGCN